MPDSLKSFLIEIECPSGAKLTGVLSRMIHAMVLELSHPGHRVPPGDPRPEDIYTYLVASPGHALRYIFEMPWEVLMRTMNQGGASGSDGDAWKSMQEQLLSSGIAEAWTNPFLARVYPKPAEEAQEAPETVQTILHGILKTLQGINPASTPGEDQKIAEDARRRLVLLIDNLDANKQASPLLITSADLQTTLRNVARHVYDIKVGPQPSDDSMNRALALKGIDALLAQVVGDAPAQSGQDLADGWGHAHEATTVQDLLREGDAMLKGTDKHEQMFRSMDDQQRLETACREIERLRSDLTTLAKRVSADAQRMGEQEKAIFDIGEQYRRIVQDTQKLYRRMKTQSLMAIYGGILPESPMEHLESQGLLFISSKGVRYEVDNMSIRGTDGFCDSLAVNAIFPDGRRERWAFHNEKSVAMNNLREKAQSIHQIIMLTKQIQKDPLLRKLFEA